MDKYHRPTIVLAEREDGLAKGSARSIDGFHLVDALQQSEQYLVKYGGHAKAAGLSLLQEHLELLYDKLIEAAESKLDEAALRPRITIDVTLRSNELTLPTALSLARLEPYGLGNPRPIFMIEKMTVVDVRTIGQTGKHLKFKLLSEDNVGLEAIAFGSAERQDEVTAGSILDFVGMLDVNEWQQRQSVQFKILDWRPSTISS
jgi:single-stranded-DNA-specific exonuclease